MVGYTLPELPTLIFPGYLDPFKVTDPAAAINAEVAKLTRRATSTPSSPSGTSAATAPTCLNPTGEPAVDLADGLPGVDAVFGGHTHTQYIHVPPERAARRREPELRSALHPRSA